MAITAFLIIDLIWLGAVARSFHQAQMGHLTRADLATLGGFPLTFALVDLAWGGVPYSTVSAFTHISSVAQLGFVLPSAFLAKEWRFRDSATTSHRISGCGVAVIDASSQFFLRTTEQSCGDVLYNDGITSFLKEGCSLGCYDDPGVGKDPRLDCGTSSEWSGDLDNDRAKAESSAGETVTIEGSPALTEGIAGYRVLGILGEGGMGVVWEAEHEQTKQRVALKVLRHEHVVDERHRRMFQREAEALARLEHPHIATIYGFGHTDDGHDFFAMEVVQGQTLDRWLAGRPDSVDKTELERRLRLFYSICDAVHYAHQRGVIHRDLKPSNIVISDPAPFPADRNQSAAGSTAKILDFGLASIPDSDLEATTRSEIGIIKGTLEYMSPEQARCDAKTIGVQSDVYALGVILYELLARSRPYDISQTTLAEALQIICEQRPRPLRHSWKGPARLDFDLVTVVEKALEKELDRRYASVADFGHDIENYLNSRPITARPRSAAYRLGALMAPTMEPVVEGAAIATVAVGNAVVSTAQTITRIARLRLW